MKFKRVKTMVLGTMALLLLMAMTGCSTMSTSYDYDDQFAWRTFKTYNWLRSTQPGADESVEIKLSGELLDGRIRDAVDFEMADRGITLSDTPEILVKYHLGAEDKLQVTDWGYSYSDYRWGYGGRNVDVYQYTQGTLVIDIIDHESDTLIWRGSATGAVQGTQRTPEEMRARVNTIVQKVMEKFPPK